MTYIYDWFQFPKFFTVVCPNCGSESQCSDILTKKVMNGVPQVYKPEIHDGSFSGTITCTSCAYHKKLLLLGQKMHFGNLTFKEKFYGLGQQLMLKPLLSI